MNSAGGLIVADLNGDGRMDYLVTVPNYLTAHAHDGRKLWVLETDLWIGGSSERIGLPGHHGPGVQAADIDGDKRVEVLFLTQDGTLHVVDGTTGTRAMDRKATHSQRHPTLGAFGSRQFPWRGRSRYTPPSH